MDRIFNVFKPKGPTSHDVVARLRRASGIRRIGHAGTLDPMAEGVLIVAISRATRVIEYLTDTDKAYRAHITFGVETDTYDAEGRVVAERSAGHLTREAVAAALSPFRGTIQQRPPAFSAISVGGQRLYDLARRGQTVDVPTREVEIRTLELEAWKPPVAVVFVECTKGTYIRSLAYDLGQVLGVGAHLSGLTRTRVGSFSSGDAVPLEQLEQALREGRGVETGVSPDQAIDFLPAIKLDTEEAGRLKNGIAVQSSGAIPHHLGTLARAYGPGDDFLAVVRLEQVHGQPAWRPEKVFG